MSVYDKNVEVIDRWRCTECHKIRWSRNCSDYYICNKETYIINYHVKYLGLMKVIAIFSLLNQIIIWKKKTLELNTIIEYIKMWFVHKWITLQFLFVTLGNHLSFLLYQPLSSLLICDVFPWYTRTTLNVKKTRLLILHGFTFYRSEASWPISFSYVNEIMDKSKEGKI